MNNTSKKTKIVARIFGGIGNQLFCYAAARRLALINDAELLLDSVSGFVYDHLYRRTFQLDHFAIPCRKATPSERMEPLSRIRRCVKRAINCRRPFIERNYIHQEGVDFDPRVLLVCPKGKVYLEGYWQSEKYFKDVETIIRQDLVMIPPTDADNQCMADRIRACESVALHVRFFDSPHVPGINNVPNDYYARAISRIEKLVPTAHYFLFSDQPVSALKLIPLPENRFTIVEHNRGDANAYADLWLMSLCQHFIIANSTFSWWGAWLSENFEKKIIAPNWKIKGDGGITSWGFEGLIPDDWQLI